MPYPVFARVGERVGATLIDVGIVFVVTAALLVFVPNSLAVVMGQLPIEAAPWWFQLLMALPWAAFPLLTSVVVVATRGATPGMALVGIRLADSHGELAGRRTLLRRVALGTAFAWGVMGWMAASDFLATPLIGLLDLSAGIGVGLLRELALAAAFLIGLQILLAPAALWIVALVWAHLDERGRTWQDIAGGTTVIRS